MIWVQFLILFLSLVLNEDRGAHGKRVCRSSLQFGLDEIPGIGPARKRALLLHFGTASKVRAAALEDLQRAPGVSATVARKVYDLYHAGG